MLLLSFPKTQFRWHLALFSNDWMRLSRICRILQIKEGVIHRGRRPSWITPSEICRILHILRKPNSIIALLFIQNISVLKGILPCRSLFFCSPKITQSNPQVFSVNGLIICNGLHFWRHFDVIGLIIWSGLYLLTSLVRYDKDYFQVWWTAAGYGELCMWFSPIRNGEIFLMNIIPFIIWLCLTRTGNYQIHEFDWLKWILTPVYIFPSRPASRPVMFWSEKVAN